MRLFSKIFLMLMMTALNVSTISAHCPRCVAIESARAEEQAEHPEQVQAGYYDDANPSQKTVNKDVIPNQAPAQSK
jgi:phage FluMu protein Com